MNISIARPLGAIIATALLFAGGCATAPRVRTNVDPSADFSQYRTFGFVEPLGTDRAGYQTIVSQHLVAATRRELESRGFTYQPAGAQLMINFNAQLSDKMRVTTVPTAVSDFGALRGYYGYRSGLYGMWPLYVDQTTVTPYTEGTLNIDVADAARKQLVWEGIVVGKVTEKTRANLQASIDEAVSLAFAKFPGRGAQ